MDREFIKRVIFCTPEVEKSTEKLLIILYGAVRCVPLEVYCQTRLLRKRLLGPKADILSAVFMVTSCAQLEALMPLQPLLEGIPVLFVLPDDDFRTVALAHRFSPRLLARGNDELNDVARVLVNILQRDGAVEDVCTV